MPLGEWNEREPPGEDFVRANLELAEASARHESAWSRIENRLRRQPLASTLLVLGLIQLTFAVAAGFRWEPTPPDWNVELGFRFSRLHPEMTISGSLAWLGTVVLLTLRRYEIRIFLAFLLAQALLVDLPTYWLFFGIAGVLGVSVHVVMND